MVSVIIPIYNTEPYLEQCIESVVNQSYRDLEIILINDGSTDGSGDICKKWEKSDSRIRYVEKCNEGQGVARNLGIGLANGEYMVFIDSDDYLDLNLIQKAYDFITEQKADICVYAHYEVGDELEPCLLYYKLQQGSNVRENQTLFSFMMPILWDKMFSSKLVKNAGITMSNRICEDLVFNGQLYGRAEKICMLNEPLYYYRYKRNGNMSTSYDRYLEVEESICELNDIFHREGLFERYWQGLYQISFTMFKDILFRIKRREDLTVPQRIKEKYPFFFDMFHNCLDRWFSAYVEMELQKKNYLLIGSYNLRVIIRNLLLEEDFLREDYGFSSMVSLMSNRGENGISLDGARFKNAYRKRCVEQDVRKTFQRKTQWDGLDYIVMDLLEETADLIEIQDGCYITESEFWQEACGEKKPFNGRNSTSFLCEKRRALFLDSINRFAEKIKDLCIPVIVVKNFLCERHSTYYDTFSNYENVEQIQKINQELEWCYGQLIACLSEKLPAGVVVVDAFGFEELVFTHDDFPFGRQPNYYNNGYYQRMAIRIGESVHHK